MWHVSIAPRSPYVGRTLCEQRAVVELSGLGDPTLGEWREWTGAAFHIRRRLTPTEQLRVGPVVDIRRTPEAHRRAAALGDRLAYAAPFILEEELGAVT